MRKLDLLSNVDLRDRSLEYIARFVVLECVLKHLQTNQRPGIDPEFYRYQEKLITSEVDDLKGDIEQLKLISMLSLSVQDA